MSEENLSGQSPQSINLWLILTVALLIGFASGLMAARSGPLTARVATTVINRCPHTLDINDEYILAGFICPNPADLIPLSGCHCTLAHQIMDRVKEELGHGIEGAEIRRTIEAEYDDRLKPIS